MADAASNLTQPVRNFQRYTSEQRSNLQASRRLGRHQRAAVGEVFWTTEAAPGIAFRTRKAALAAAKLDA